jgi:hypothetical protein
MNQRIMKDALHNLRHDSGASDEYCRGLVVGLLTGLVARGVTYNDAEWEVMNCLPESNRVTYYHRLPEIIRKSFVDMMDKKAEERLTDAGYDRLARGGV